MVYMNTNVTRGAGEFVVTATGMATEVGHISGMLQTEEAAKTPLTRQLEQLTTQILVIAGVALAASVALYLARGDDLQGRLHRRDRLRHRRHPDRPARGGHHDPGRSARRSWPRPARS